MDFAEVMNKRRMVRNFTDEPVSEAALDRILHAARRAPSAGFSQGQSYIVITQLETKQRVAALCGQASYVESGFDPFLSRAAVQIIPCTNEQIYHRRYQEADKVQTDGSEIEWPVPYWFMDIGCGVMAILLAAVNEGLAAGYAGFHDLGGARTLLGIPDEVTPMGVIPIGHPAPDKKSPSLKRGHKPAAEVIHRERW